MTIKVKLKSSKLCEHSYIVAVFFEKGKLMLKGVSKSAVYPIEKVDSIQMYDYD